jgi:hypothetical protein
MNNFEKTVDGKAIPSKVKVRATLCPLHSLDPALVCSVQRDIRLCAHCAEQCGPDGSSQVYL